MKEEDFRGWREVFYGSEEFKFWSDTSSVFGDKRLPKESPQKDWRIVLIFTPFSWSGSMEPNFFVGFLLPTRLAKTGLAKIWTVPRKVGDGMFAMLLGPGDCHFFVAGNDEKIGLSKIPTFVEREEFEKDERFSAIKLYCNQD